VKKILVLSVLVGILMMAGCSLSSGIPATETVSSVGTEIASALPPDVAVQIQNQVSQAIGVPVDQIQIKTVEQRDWPDSCLGLGKPDESCAQVITPGWLVVFNASGKEYSFRADETGTNIRQEP
jgi:hypothetical protein